MINEILKMMRRCILQLPQVFRAIKAGIEENELGQIILGTLKGVDM